LDSIVAHHQHFSEFFSGLLELAFIDFQAIDVFNPNVAVALVVKVLPVSSGVLDRVAQP
jgi:hypothetical protein